MKVSVNKETVVLNEMPQNELKFHGSLCLPFLFDRIRESYGEA